MESVRAKKSPVTVQKKMMDYLAIRDHSENELRQKLEKLYTADEIDAAVTLAKQKNWIPDTPEANLAVSEETANALGRKGRGINFINEHLKKKGLPEISRDSSVELEKAQRLVENKYSDFSEMDQDQKAKVGRFLLSRGFEMEVVEKVIYES
jgi:regulatory protein